MKLNDKKKIIVISIFVIVMIIFCTVVAFSLKKNTKTEVEIGGQTIDVIDKGDGLYSDKYINDRYIYRGSNPNNYITFNGELWRIVSVDKDGNIQIMRNDILDVKTFDSKGVRDVNGTDGGSYCEDADDGCNAWTINENIVGEPKNFVNGDFSGEVKKDSEMFTYLNGEYLKSLKDSDYIINHNWSIGGVAGDASLKSQTYTEQMIEWNGKVGLITASDYIKATTGNNCESLDSMNLNYASCKEKNWMFKEGTAWWTISPMDNASVQLWYIGEAGFINNDSASKEFGVRPVVYLSDDILLTGDGTINSPYILKS